MIVDRRDDLEAAPLVEHRRLEGERHQHDLRAAAPSRLLLGGLKQFRPESAATLGLLHPELAQLTSAAPRVSADPRHDGIALAHQEREHLTVGDAGRPRVELVDPILQKLHFVRRWVYRYQRDFTHSLAPFHVLNAGLGVWRERRMPASPSRSSRPADRARATRW